MHKSILELTGIEARAFFLKHESYCNFDLPQYFTFSALLNTLSRGLESKKLSDYFNPSLKPHDCEEVNYTFLANKDSKFGWRPLQLIHPALYVSLVHSITEESYWSLIVDRFKEFSANPKIKCYSIPAQSEDMQSDRANMVVNWLRKVEVQSIELALKYQYVLHTDISDCYGSIYTHSIPWALHGQKFAKDNRKAICIGNCIDLDIRRMSFNQTNGIPQGSVLMDFIAEMVLGYADMELSTKITNDKIQDYEIIRYRDDYRIFSNNPQDAERITKLLTEVLIGLGMRLNSQKTFLSVDVITDAVKPDKLYWNQQKNSTENIQKHLLLIHDLALKFPNSGSVVKALQQFYEKVEKIGEIENCRVLISIIVDIAYKNSRTYPIAVAILSKLIVDEFWNTEEIL